MQQTNNNEITNDLARELLKEKRADRRWRNIRSILWFLLFTYTLFSILNWFGKPSLSTTAANGKYVSLIYLDGMIAPGREFSAKEVLPILKEAFSDKSAAGVVININSPGGTPVQAAIIHDTIIDFKQKYHKKVVIVGEDLLTSGAYYVAVSADKIYVNPNTLTGSIGVIMKGFGFVELMKKLGIERRVYVAGNDKDRLDPFLPQSPEDLKKVSQVMEEVHQNFVQAVLKGREGKLHGDQNNLFSGDFWPGQTAKQLGLIDELGNLMDAMNKEFNTTNYKEYGGGGFMRFLGGQINSAVEAMFYT